jgi:hypothetical protein
VRRAKTTVIQEVLWLAAWLALFVAVTWVFLKFVVPHHFNDRVAVVVSAIISSLAWIALRAYVTRRT